MYANLSSGHRRLCVAIDVKLALDFPLHQSRNVSLHLDWHGNDILDDNHSCVPFSDEFSHMIHKRNGSVNLKF